MLQYSIAYNRDGKRATRRCDAPYRPRLHLLFAQAADREEEALFKDSWKTRGTLLTNAIRPVVFCHQLLAGELVAPKTSLVAVEAEGRSPIWHHLLAILSFGC